MKNNYIKLKNWKNKKINIGRITETKKEILKNCSLNRCGYNFNGYGYADWDYIYIVNNKQLKEIENILNLPEKKSKQQTEKQKKHAWIKRLIKLTGITARKAILIYNEKQNYKMEKIEEMEEKQIYQYSAKRQKLINKMYRENPCRRIENEEHAWAIISASNRHSTDYDSKLKYIHNLEESGIIEKGYAQELARNNTFEELIQKYN